MDRELALATLESVIVENFDPYFYQATFLDDDYNIIHCVVSSFVFDNIPVDSRTKMVFNVLKSNSQLLLKEYNIVVECFNYTEVVDLIDLLNTEENS
jgi:hypothetical protein